eukprot:1384291-Rhodomonas_salina.1
MVERHSLRLPYILTPVPVSWYPAGYTNVCGCPGTPPDGYAGTRYPVPWYLGTARVPGVQVAVSTSAEMHTRNGSGFDSYVCEHTTSLLTCAVLSTNRIDLQITTNVVSRSIACTQK